MSHLDKFKLKHPFCCFCGGGVATEQIDHVPPKAIFNGKAWPEGYEFPACASCNQGSRQIDQVAAMIARMSVADDHVDPDEFAKYHQGVRNNQPSALPSFIGSEEQQAMLLEQLGLEKAKETPWRDVPMVLIEASEFRKLDLLVGKLFCALFYKHAKRIVPKATKVIAMYTTNQILSADDPFGWQRNELAQNEVRIARGNRDLRHQFDYVWGYLPEEDTFSASFQIRKSVFGTMLGPVSEAEWQRVPEDMRLLSSAA